MAQYLTEDEILVYCQLQAGVTQEDVIIASELIDSYVGKSFSVKEISESIKVNDKRRGKLNYFPVVKISKVEESVVTAIGITTQSVSPDKIVLDIEQDGYFTYIAPTSPFACPSMFGCQANTNKRLNVTYQYGYSAIPQDIKIVCAMLAQNIRQLQTFAGIAKLTTLDYTVQMANPSFFTDDMRIILAKYR